VVLVVVGVGDSGCVVRVSRGVGVDVTSSRVSCRAGVVVSVVVLLLVVSRRRVGVVVGRLVVVLLRVGVVVLLVVTRCRLVVTRCRLVVSCRRVGVVVTRCRLVVLLLRVGVVVLLVVRSRLRRPGRRGPPVRQRGVDQVVHRLEQVLDAVARRDAGVAEVRDQLGRDVVHGHVGHGLAALGRGEGRCHLVLEEAGEGGGHGPVALRVGDALVLFCGGKGI
jgi:hypothetical protein